MRSRRRIIDATLRLIETKGFPAVNVAAVADEAGVSRQTVYSIFGSRETLVSQAVAEVAQDGMREMAEQLAACSQATDFIVELAVVGRVMVRAHPAMASLIVAERGNPIFDQGMMPRATAVAKQILLGAVERDARLAPVLDELAEMVTRMALSVILFESDRIASDDDLRDFLRRWLLPAVSAMIEAPFKP